MHPLLILNYIVIFHISLHASDVIQYSAKVFKRSAYWSDLLWTSWSKFSSLSLIQCFMINKKRNFLRFQWGISASSPVMICFCLHSHRDKTFVYQLVPKKPILGSWYPVTAPIPHLTKNVCVLAHLLQKISFIFILVINCGSQNIYL